MAYIVKTTDGLAFGITIIRFRVSKVKVRVRVRAMVMMLHC